MMSVDTERLPVSAPNSCGPRDAPSRPVHASGLRFRQRAVLLLVGCAVASLICELMARIVFPAPPYPYLEPRLVFVRDSELSYCHQPNQTGWLDGGLASINSLGLRGREPVVPKSRSVLRVLVIGDSIAFGWGVNDAETFCQQLQNKLSRDATGKSFEIVNGGVSGYATNQERTLLNHFAPKLNPDLVLIAFYWNDLLMGGTDDNANATEIDGGTNIVAAQLRHHETFHMTGSGRWWDRLLRHSRAVFVAGRAIKGVFGRTELNEPRTFFEDDLLHGRHTTEVDQRWLGFERELKSIHRIAARNGFDVGIVVLPSRQQVGADFPEAQIQSRVREIAERYGIFVIDPLTQFREHRDDVDTLFIPYDRHHPSAMGHQIVADVIAKDLRNNDRMGVGGR